MKKALFLAVAALMLLAGAGNAEKKKPLMLCDFENMDEVAKYWDILNMKVEFVPDNATSGKACMKMTFTADQPKYTWSKITSWMTITADEKANIIKWWDGEYTEKTKFGSMPNNWDDYDVLKFDIFSPNKEVFKIGCCAMDDNSWTKDGPSYENRYNFEKIIKPGKNTIEVENGDFNTEAGGRLNIKKLKCFWIGVDAAMKDKVLFIDNMRLEKSEE